MDGAKEQFNPNSDPQSVRAAARRAYRAARRTLIIQYDNDPMIDESEESELLLKEAETVMKNKRPMVDFDVKLHLKNSSTFSATVPSSAQRQTN